MSTSFKAFINQSLTEAVNFGELQQKVYDFVLKKLKELNPNMHHSYASDLAKTTDQFWHEKFDDLLKAINTSEDLNEIEDELRTCIETIGKVICDFFVDSMNHPPGYQARRLVSIDYDTATDEEIEGLLKKIDPKLRSELDNRS